MMHSIITSTGVALRKMLPARFYATSNVISVFKLLCNNHNINAERVELQGWVKSVRKMKEYIFFDVSDGSCNGNIQIVLPQLKKPQGLSPGASVIVTGTVGRTPKGQPEVNADGVRVCGECDVRDGYPFPPKKTHSPDFARQYLHFRPRIENFASLLRIRDGATRAIHGHFHEEGHIQIHTPVLTTNDCEGAGEIFSALPDSDDLLKKMAKPNVSHKETFFDSKAFLTVSGQMHLEAAAHAFSKVYAFGPTFRAENSKSRLHLSEFYMVEAELAFVDTLQTVMASIERLLKAVTANLLNNFESDLRAVCEEDAKPSFAWIDDKFPVLEYEEAAAILEQNRDKYKTKFNKDFGLTKDHEKFLVEYCGGVPTFVINWPKEIKPFYMRECQNNSEKVAALDLLVPNVGELVGGSLRENDLAKLETSLADQSTNLQWYLDIRRYGGVPTGGYGLGFERYLQLICGLTNIKDTIPFPRWPHNCQL